MTLIEILQLLLFTLGVLSFGSLTAAWWREWRQGSGNVGLGLGLMVSFCVVWFLVHLAKVGSAYLFPERTTSLQLLGWSMTYAFPPLIQRISLDEARRREPALGTFWEYAAWLGIPAAILAGAPPFLLCLGWSTDAYLRVAVLALCALFGLTGIYSVAISWVTRRPREPKSQTRARHWETGLWVLVVIVIGLNLIPGLEDRGLLSLIGPAFPLLFVFSSTYHLERFLFFDLFVKRGVFSCLVLVLLALHFLVLAKLLEDLPAGAIRPWIYALGLLPLGLALPWLYRRLEEWVDRSWLGRPFQPLQAVKHFLSGIQTSASEAQLIRHAEDLISEIFQTRARIFLHEPPQPPAGFLLVPFQLQQGLRGAIQLGVRANQQPFYGSDLSLIGSLMEVFARVLENVRLEESRREQDLRAQQLQVHASQSELKALRAQINPHFLFNALNAIAGLIHEAPEKAEETIEQLAEVFRYTLRGSQNEWALLREELEFVKAYLEVERARFGERLEVSIEVDPALTDVRVPTMIVQTLVENAVKHGVAALQGVGRISVRCLAQGSRVRLEVRDNGPGPEATRRRSQAGGFGLHNVRERLDGYFGDQASLDLQRDEANRETVASFQFPRRWESRERVLP